MSKPSISNIPGIGAMTDTLDFVKNLWGGMNVPGMGIPGMIMPTLSVEEINKQIADLKTVESWLTLNMNMLRGTIQALEVQSATISTLKSMGTALSAAVSPSSSAQDKAASAAAAPTAKKAEPPAVAPEPEKAAPAAETAKKTASAPEGGSAPLANPAIWWNMLQDQFKQAVDTAMASEKKKPSPSPVASKPEAKPAPKKAAAPRKRKAAKPKES